MPDILASDLATGLLAQGQTVRLRAMGGSMRPWLAAGTVVTVAPTTRENVQVGDIAFLVSGGQPMLHRVVQTTPTLRTKGDALGYFDAAPDTVLGRVVAPPVRAGRLIARLSCFCLPMQRAVLLLRQLARQAQA